MGPIKLSQQDLDAIKAENLRKFRERGLGEYLHSIDAEPYDLEDFMREYFQAERTDGFQPTADYLRQIGVL